jgi:hypothetical protein
MSTLAGLTRVGTFVEPFPGGCPRRLREVGVLAAAALWRWSSRGAAPSHRE